MGSRGAHSGIADNGMSYGTEYRTEYQLSNIKYVKYNFANNAKSPKETMTVGRVYATINNSNNVAYITVMGKGNKVKKTIDLLHFHRELKGIHVHFGEIHDEKGTRLPTPKESKLVELVVNGWLNRSNK